MSKTRAVKDSLVTITGGTGSFGSTMAKHLLRRDASEVKIFSRDEAKRDAIRHAIADSRVRFYLGKTRDPESVERVVRFTDLMFHAAALTEAKTDRRLRQNWSEFMYGSGAYTTSSSFSGS